MSADAPLDAVRVGPGQFLLAAERVGRGSRFTVDGETWQVDSEPAAVGAGNYIATITQAAGPNVDRRLGAQLRVGRRVR